MRPRLTLTLGASLAVVVVLLIAVRYAEPILDGDLFFHLAYARQMLARATLIPDHTLYSWTPASNAAIYCAWLSQLVLYGVWNAFGLPVLFALRYAVVGGVVLLLWLHARRWGLLAAGPTYAVATYLILTVVAVGAYAGSLIKPELFSLLFLHLVLCAYFHGKSTPERAATFFWVPAVLVLWVNSHGGFILLAPFLVLSAVGELANRRFSLGCALPWPALRRMLGAWGLCGLAALLTPYGWRYPRQLIEEYVLRGTPRPDTVWNTAYQPTLAYPSLSNEHVPLIVSMALVLVVLLAVQAGLGARGARVDWALVLVNAVYVPLYLLHVRSTYWWPAIFGWSAVYLLARLRSADVEVQLPARFASRAGKAIAVVAVLATLWLSARTARAAWLEPASGSWLGFGVSDVSPVTEAEYLARMAFTDRGQAESAGTRLYNIFDSGGYLLWRLWPQYRVMTDSRSFPYLDWFPDQFRFTMGQSFAEFLARYPADIAVIDHRKYPCQRNFLSSLHWRPIFYGPTAIVFVRRESEAGNLPPGRPAHGGIDQLRNGQTALIMFEAAVLLGDHTGARKVLAQLEGPLRRHVAAPQLVARHAYLKGLDALSRRDFEPAHALLREGLSGRLVYDRDRLALGLLEQRATALAAGRLADAALSEETLAWLVATR